MRAGCFHVCHIIPQMYYMKKTIAIIFVMIITLASIASAEHFSSLSQLQHFIMARSSDQIEASGPHTVELSGSILDIYPYGIGNHYEMLIQVDDAKAVPAMRYSAPVLVVHFRLHVNPVPFQVGDHVTVRGDLNSLYSSPIIPWILADLINGSPDF